MSTTLLNLVEAQGKRGQLASIWVQRESVKTAQTRRQHGAHAMHVIAAMIDRISSLTDH